jgi:hypothetical protein
MFKIIKSPNKKKNYLKLSINLKVKNKKVFNKKFLKFLFYLYIIASNL